MLEKNIATELLEQGYKRLKYKVFEPTTLMYLFVNELDGVVYVDDFKLFKRENGELVEIISDGIRLYDYDGIKYMSYVNPLGLMKDNEEYEVYIKLKKDLTRIYYLFGGCDFLVEVSSDLFEGLYNVENADNLFYECRGIKNIPNGLFKDMKSLKKIRFAFSYCTRLECIPKDLFANNPNIEDDTYLFANCISLERIDNDIISNLKKLKKAKGLFKNCISLKGTQPITFNGVPLSEDDNILHSESFYMCKKMNDYIDDEN